MTKMASMNIIISLLVITMLVDNIIGCSRTHHRTVNCYGSSSCSISMGGDTHVDTIDGMHYDFHGECSYKLLITDLTTVVGKSGHCGKKRATCLKTLSISSGATVLSLGPKREYELSEKQEVKDIMKPFCNEDLCFYEVTDMYDAVDLKEGIQLI